MRGLASINMRWVVWCCVCECVCECACARVCVSVCVNLTVWVLCVIQHQYALCEPMRGLASINKRWVVWCCVCVSVCVVCACVCQSHRVGFVCHLASVCSV